MKNNTHRILKIVNIARSITKTKDAKVNDSKGEQIARIIAKTFKAECGPFGGENPHLKGNKVGLYSQAKEEWYEFLDDGRVKSGSKTWNSVEDLFDSGRSWFMYVPNKQGVLSEVKNLLTKDAKDADSYTFRLSKKTNDYDEYTIKCFKNGARYSAGDYMTDDWDDAIGTLKDLAKRNGLTYHQQGSMHVADCASLVKDSPASEIVSEIKRAYPKVQITQYSQNRKQGNEEYHLVKMMFKNYPGEGATGSGNDPRTAERDKWERFLQYIYKKYTGQDGRFDAFAENLTIYDFPKHDSKDSCNDELDDDELNDDELDDLITEEYDAIADYSATLATCNSEHAKNTLRHILEEEKEHVKELEQLRQMRADRVDDAKVSGFLYPRLEKLGYSREEIGKMTSEQASRIFAEKRKKGEQTGAKKEEPKKDISGEELDTEIKNILEDLVTSYPSTARQAGWNNIVENHVWNELKKKGLLSKFPSNLYKKIRKIYSDPDLYDRLRHADISSKETNEEKPHTEETTKKQRSSQNAGNFDTEKYLNSVNPRYRERIKNILNTHKFSSEEEADEYIDDLLSED